MSVVQAILCRHIVATNCRVTLPVRGTQALTGSVQGILKMPRVGPVSLSLALPGSALADYLIVWLRLRRRLFGRAAQRSAIPTWNREFPEPDVSSPDFR
jgi:hypothetical protein